ncbi:MBL fold metallo-hydrolase [Clostridium sp. AL.422]|uniref:MBL fold metallo-hydrolase n=1 Tax=Clostridium TaxID=1485 RepID=UPI00293DEEF9|nr:MULTISPECIES: MBL fold metallo-hydrolase [unclassified Clostridium]MDV4151442.1 MBL fold metallo-hydrolase [Clostridium sp. AL.422]
MKIKENIYVLELPNINPQSKDFVYPTVIKDKDNLTLIDTGYPGQIDYIKAELEKDGLDVNNIKTIILTHHDIDHMGNVKAILKLVSNIEVITFDKEADYINGSKTPYKVEYMEKNLNKLDEKGREFYNLFKLFYDNNKIDVIKTVNDNDVINKGEAIRVIATPGHTLGHMSLYIDKYKLLIAGDLLISKAGEVTTCPKELNYDNDMYLKSINKIKKLDIETVICFHGGVSVLGNNLKLGL